MSKKIIYLILSLFICNYVFADPVVFTKAPEKLSKDLIERSWFFEIIGENNSYIDITFNSDNTYDLYSPFGGNLSSGTYSIDGDMVIVNPSKSFDYKFSDIIFKDGKDLVLVYDSEYITFKYVGALKNDKIILTNEIEKTPDNAQCWLGGVEVQKEIKWVEATDNLRLRLEPSLSGRVLTYCYNHYFMSLQNELSNAGYEIIQNNFIGPCERLNLLLKGKVCKTIAHTIQKETIDGISDYWYYIEMTDYTDPGWTEYYWVFGGYLKITDSSNDNYSVLFKAAREKGILRKKEF